MNAPGNAPGTAPGQHAPTDAPTDAAANTATDAADSLGAAPTESRMRRGAREMSTLVKASISSGIATAADGLTYQLLLVAVTNSYTAAALAGAFIGGVSNFTINRRWVFKSASKRLRKQAAEYAAASFATYLALQTCLFVLIEVLNVGEHAAWVPAKAIAWVFVSYPIQRFLVFSSGPRLEAERPNVAV